MNSVSLDATGSNHWTFKGELDFSTVPDAWKLLHPLLRGGDSVTLSLAGVSRSNSAALALLLQAVDVARQSGARLRLEDLPEELASLAHMSNLDLLFESQ